MRAVALVFGGVPYQGDPVEAVGRTYGGLLPYLNIDPSGLGARFRGGFPGGVEENQTHHYAGALLAGYHLGGGGGAAVNFLHEVGGFVQSLREGSPEWDPGDVPLGTVAAGHGWELRVDAMGPLDLGGRVRRDLLATRRPAGP